MIGATVAAMPEATTTELVAIRLSRAALPDALERVWDGGSAALPLDAGLPDRQVRELIGRLKPHRIVTEEGTSSLPGGRGVDAEVAVVLATSGTTGAPKGVELGWTALNAAAQLTNETLGASRRDRWLCSLPPSHVAGFMTMFRSRALGSRAVVHDRFDPDKIACERAARFVSLVPTMLVRLLSAGVDLTHFDAILIGGDHIDPSLVRTESAAGARVITTYGMTETCGGVVYDGSALPGVDVSLTEDGVIQIAGPTIMRGYRLDEKSTRRVLVGGRFITSDRGEIDDKGRLRVLGRVDDVIVSAGNKVVPRQVADVLTEHPAIEDASIEAVADPELGQRMVARISLRKGSPAPSLEELRAFVAERLGAHQAPRGLIVQTGTGAHWDPPTERSRDRTDG